MSEEAPFAPYTQPLHPKASDTTEIHYSAAAAAAAAAVQCCCCYYYYSYYY